MSSLFFLVEFLLPQSTIIKKREIAPTLPLPLPLSVALTLALTLAKSLPHPTTTTSLQLHFCPFLLISLPRTATVARASSGLRKRVSPKLLLLLPPPPSSSSSSSSSDGTHISPLHRPVIEHQASSTSIPPPSSFSVQEKKIYRYIYFCVITRADNERE